MQVELTTNLMHKTLLPALIATIIESSHLASMIVAMTPVSPVLSVKLAASFYLHTLYSSAGLTDQPSATHP